MSTTSADQRLPALPPWRRAFDPPGAAHTAAWATLEQLRRLWQAGSGSNRPDDVSLLTPSGAPVEFTFRTGSDTLSYTAEPGLPLSSPAAKWRTIAAIVGIGSLDRKTNDLLSLLRAQPDQRFGCWLGVRQSASAVGFKVYQEVTPFGHELVRRNLLVDLPSLDPKPRIVPQLVGQALPAGATEFYFHITDPRPSTLHALLKAADAAERLRLVTDCLAWLAAIPASQLREQLRIGLSYRVAAGQPTIVTFFVHAAQISESNQQIRQRLLELARQLGLDFTQYERATHSLADWEPPIPAHGLVGVTIEPSGNVSLSVGVTPPLDQPASANCCDNRA
jgi:hypothetical protein